MSTQTFEASSVDKALEEAAGALGMAAGDLQYEVEEKASDFWGLGETVYVVTVTLPEAEPAEAASAPAESPTAEPVAEDTAEPVAEVAAESVEEEPNYPEEATADAVGGDASPAQEEPAGEDTPAFFSHSEGEPTETEAAAASVSDDEATEPPVEAPSPTPPVTTSPAPADDGEAPADTAPADGTDLTAEAAAILDGIFAAMGFECTAEAKLEADTMQVAITGEDNQYLLEGRGRGLAALELILNHSFRGWPDRAHKRVRVDAGDFRSQRDDEIRDMAYQVAHLAKETGEEQQTSDLNPYERRIVHLTLADDPRITTRSRGNGFLKAVNVIPTGEGQRRDQ